MRSHIVLLLSLSFFLMGMDDTQTSQSSEELSEKSSEGQNDKGKNEIVAMPNSSEEGTGLTVGEAKAFLYDQQKLHKWHWCCCDDGAPSCPVACWSWGIAGPSWILFVVGTTLAKIYCSNNGWIGNCQHICGNYGCESDCNNGFGYCSSDQNCFPDLNSCNTYCGSHNTTTSFDPLCITGSTMIAIPIVMTGLAILSQPLNHLRNRFVTRSNRQLQYNIDHNFARGRGDDEICDEKDLVNIGPLLMAANSPLLRRLSCAQALGLAKIGLGKLRALANSNVLPQKIFVPIQKLLRLLEMDINADYELLATTLKSEDMPAIFDSEPSLLQALIQNLSSAAIKDDEIRRGLKINLKAVTKCKAKLNAEIWDHAINNIAKGSSLVSQFSTPVAEKEETINLKVGDQVFTFKKKVAIAASSTLSSYFEDFFPKRNEMEFKDDVKPEWIQVLAEVVQGKQIELSDKNVLDVLESATYFDLQPPVEKCDSYLLAHGISKDLIARWQRNSGEHVDKEHAIEPKWEFCVRFGLLQNQQALALKYIKELDSLTGKEVDSSVFDKIKLLNLSHVAEPKISTFYRKFKTKLNNYEYLKWVWQRGHDVEIIRSAVVEFCEDPKNNPVVQIAWATKPPDLKEALVEAQNKAKQ